jgi:hypothetical protein
MIKLTDIQTILLSSAAQRADASLLPAPALLDATPDRIAKTIAALVARGYAEETSVLPRDPAWRVDDDRHYGAIITDAGRAVIGVATNDDGDSGVTPPTREQREEATAAAVSDRPSKAMLVLSLLQREQGATLAEMVEATGWLPHTTRAALTGIRKKGHAVARGKRDDVTCYTLAA